MKLASLWLAVLGFAVIVTGSCTIDHHSSDFACTQQSDCRAGRTCSDGFCVIPVDAGVKPDGPPGDGAKCPSGCTSCNADTKMCTIDCALNNGACNQLVTCPIGWSCDIACSTSGACSKGINCTGGKACTITCDGRQSCQGVSCGTGPCKVDCNGRDSCNNVVCGLACACDITCHINSACTSLTCKLGCDTLSPFGGCTSTTTGCNTCL